MTTPDARPAIDARPVRRLLDTQFPQCAVLVDPAGSDHVIYRLGDELAVRLPRHRGAIRQAETEFHWLPRLAPHLPLAIPAPVAVGRPDFGYPWMWAVSRWLDGEVATVEALGGSVEAAVELAEFLQALHRIAVSPGGAADRGLAERDQATRATATSTPATSS